MHATELIIKNLDWYKILKHYDAEISYESEKQIRCKCFIHGGDNTSAFVINLTNNLWYCHTGCKIGGDVFDLIAAKEKLQFPNDFPKAVEIVSDILGIDITNLKIVDRTPAYTEEIRKWIQYIAKQSHKKQIETFDLSVLGDLQPITKLRNINADLLKSFNISYSPYYKRIVFPIYLNKKIIGVSMRRTNKAQKAKWIHQPEGITDMIYNWDRAIDNIIKTQTATICEGPFDVLSCWQHGIPNAIASFGSHLTNEQTKQICQYAVNINLMYDNDIAGRNAVRRLILPQKNKQPLSYYANVQIVDLPEGKDPGDLSIDEWSFLKLIKPHEFINKYGKEMEYINV